MERNYTVEDGKLLLITSKTYRKNVIYLYLYKILRMAFLVASLDFTVYITWIIFKECINEISLKECIPLGSIFATFGSAIIAVFSIYCNEQSALFQENLGILRSQIPELQSWQRWIFLKRYSKKKVSFLHSNYYQLHNPQITFESNVNSLTIPIPFCTVDFKDLPIVINTIRLIGFRRHYTKYIFMLHKVEQQKDIFMLNCILMIYSNIIRYKLSIIIVWLGAEMVFSSIIFSFFYKQIDKIILYLIAYL